MVGTLAEDGDSSISSMMSGSSDVLIPCTTALKMNGESLVTNLTVYIDSTNEFRRHCGGDGTPAGQPVQL